VPLQSPHRLSTGPEPSSEPSAFMDPKFA